MSANLATVLHDTGRVLMADRVKPELTRETETLQVWEVVILPGRLPAKITESVTWW